MNDIHETAVIEDGAELGANNIIGPYCYITSNAKIGDDNHFVSHVCVGTPAQHRLEKPEGSVEIGSNNIVHSFSQFHCSTNTAAPTRIGNNCLLMTNSHIAHDCILEDNVTMSTNTTLGGHTYIMLGANLGFGTITHQKQIIGSYSMTGMGSVFPKNTAIKPGYIWAGNPANILKKNVIGLERNNVDDAALAEETKRFELLEMGWTGRKPQQPESHLEEFAIRAILEDYAKVRDRRYDDVKWQLCDSVTYLFSEQIDWSNFVELYDQTFSLLWQQMDDFKDTQFEIRERLIEPAQKLFSPEPLPGGQNTGWLLRNMTTGMYAPYRHTKAFMIGQAATGNPTIAYCYGPADPNEVRELSQHGIQTRVSTDPSQLRAWFEMDQVGCLIADSYSAHTLALFEMRSAPVQFYLSPGMQMFPADAVLIPPTQNHWADTTIDVPSPMLWNDLYQDIEVKPKPGKVVFGTLGRYEKCDSSFLRVVRRLLDLVPDSVYCAYGRGSLVYEDQRILKMGYENPHAVLPNIDLYLDSFPTCGGVSCWQAMAHRVPMVTLSAEAWDSWNVVKPHVCETEKDYVETALQLLEKPETEKGYRAARRFADVNHAGKNLNRTINEWLSTHTQTSKQRLQTGL